MRYFLIFFSISILSACTSQITNNNDLGLQIDIYKKDMNYEKFKQSVIEYAENAPYPSLIKND